MLRGYDAHAGFFAPALASRALWRLVVGFAVAGAIYVGCSQVYFGALYTLIGPRSAALFGDLLAGTTPAAMFALLGSFAFMTLGVAIVVRFLHRRSLASVLGPRHLFMPQFRAVLGAAAILGVVVFILPPWDMGGTLTPNMPFGRWALLLPFSLAVVFLQVSAEEIVFRGYVQQQLAARFRSPLMWMVLPAALFALGHYLPDQAGENAGIIALWAGLFGMLMADLTARAGSLGPAIAVHFANNVSAIVLTSLPDDLSGLALFLTPFGMDDADALRAWLPVDFALMLVGWLAARLAIRR